MFLHTLGLKTDGMITSHFNSKTNGTDGLAKLEDERGLISREFLKVKKEETEKLVISHIEKFHPVVSHYNLLHSPNRRYLSPELTIKFLWTDYCSIYNKISYDLYRKYLKYKILGLVALRKMNVALV